MKLMFKLGSAFAVEDKIEFFHGRSSKNNEKLKSIIMKSFFKVVGILLFSLTMAHAFAQSGSEIVPGNEVGNDIGDFEAKGIDGSMKKLSDLRGKTVLLVLWNSKCGHCVTENKYYQDAYNQFHDKQFSIGQGFDVYQIGLDKEEATWKDYIEANNFPYTNHVYVLDSWKDDDVRFFGVKNLPGTFLLDANGIILEKDFGGKELPTLLEKYQGEFNLTESQLIRTDSLIELTLNGRITSETLLNLINYPQLEILDLTCLIHKLKFAQQTLADGALLFEISI
jgi:thiol-disulfide isomerase/thioredoxin